MLKVDYEQNFNLINLKWEIKKNQPKRRNYIVQTADRSYKDNTLLFTWRKTNVLCMPDQMCYACQTKYTVKHIPIECTDLAHIRKTFYSANNMKELFQNSKINNVI